MIKRAGLTQASALVLILLLVVVISLAGREVQAAPRLSSGIVSSGKGNYASREPRSPEQLDHMVYLPIVVTSCLPDPPGDSDNIDDALIVCSGQTVPGQVGDDDWDDVYQVRAVANQQLTVSLNGTGGDADLYLYAPDATDIYSDDYADSSTNIGNDELIEGTVPEEGYWYIDVNSFEGTTDYQLTVTLSGP